MSHKVKPIPEGFDTVTPYIVADDAKSVIAFMQKAFSAKLDHPPTMRPDGKIMHASMQVGTSRVMIADSSDQAMASPVMLYVYVPDVDAVYRSAIAAEAPRSWNPPICSMVIAVVESPIWRATSGSSERASKMLRRTNCRRGLTRCSRISPPRRFSQNEQRASNFIAPR